MKNVSSGSLIPTKELHFPEGCTHFRKFDHYQIEIYQEALKHTPNRGCAVDVGAHVGIFTLYMERDFDKVVAFEPIEKNYLSLLINVRNHAVNTEKVSTRSVALSDKTHAVQMICPCNKNSGTWMVSADGKVTVNCMPLDLFSLRPNLIKLDIQGHELPALRGAYNTITQYKPTLIVEVWNVQDTMHLTNYIEKTLNYKQAARISKDCVYIPKE